MNPYNVNVHNLESKPFERNYFLTNFFWFSNDEVARFFIFYDAEQKYFQNFSFKNGLFRKLFSYFEFTKNSIFNIEEFKRDSAKKTYDFIKNLDPSSFKIFKEACKDNYNVHQDLSLFFTRDMILYYDQHLNYIFFKENQDKLNQLISSSSHPLKHLCINIQASINYLFNVQKLVEVDKNEPYLTDLKIGCLRFYYLARIDDLLSLLYNKYRIESLDQLNENQRFIFQTKPFVMNVLDCISKSKFIKQKINEIVGKFDEVNLLKQIDRIFTNDKLRNNFRKILSHDYDMVYFIYNDIAYEEVENIYFVRRALHCNVVNNYVCFEPDLKPVFDFLVSNFNKHSELCAKYKLHYKIELYGVLKSCMIKYSKYDLQKYWNKSLAIRELNFILHKLVRDQGLVGYLEVNFERIYKTLNEYHRKVSALVSQNTKDQLNDEPHCSGCNKNKRNNDDEDDEENNQPKDKKIKIC